MIDDLRPEEYFQIMALPNTLGQAYVRMARSSHPDGALILTAREAESIASCLVEAARQARENLRKARERLVR